MQSFILELLHTMKLLIAMHAPLCFFFLNITPQTSFINIGSSRVANHQIIYKTGEGDQTKHVFDPGRNQSLNELTREHIY
jgi:hypothetical protein